MADRVTTTLAVGMAVLTAAGVIACGSDGSGGGAGERRLTVGYAFDPDAGEIGGQVAIERLERRTGIEVEPKDVGSSDAAIAALVNGEIHMTSVGLPHVINAVAGEADLVAILADEMRPEWMLAASAGIDTLEELRNKRIAADPPGEDTAALVDLALEKAGLGKDEVNLSILDESTQRAIALGAGRLDATPLEYLDLERLRRDGVELNVLAELQDLSPVEPRTVFVVTRDFANENRELLEELVTGLLDGYAFLYTKPGKEAWVKAARETVLKDDPPALAASTYEFYRDLGYWPRGRPATEDDFDRSLEYWVNTKQVVEPASFSEIWDISFWRQASSP